jgi:hypothetical protein
LNTSCARVDAPLARAPPMWWVMSETAGFRAFMVGVPVEWMAAV